MNPRKIRLWIGLLTAALAALIGVQMYWALEAYRLGEEKFNQKVVSALQKTADAVNEHNECFVLFSKAYINPKEGFYMAKQKWTDDKFLPDAVTKPDTVTMFSRWFNDKIPFNHNALLFNNPVTADIVLKFRYHFEDSALMRSEQANTFEQLTSANFLDKISGDRPVEKHYDMPFLDSMLRKHLKDENIDERFHYGIVRTDKDSAVYLSVNADAEKVKTALTASLNRDPYFSKPYGLAVYFDNKSGVVLAAFGGILLTSAAVIALFVLSFWYFVRTVMKQKKLTDIKNDFIDNMTHEFNTPITNIGLAVETLRANGHDRDKQNKLLEIVHAENDRMRRNVEKVLQLALVEKEGIALNPRLLRAEALVTTVVEQFKVKAGQRNVDVRFESGCNGAAIDGDETHLVNVLHNLLDNALKYSKENGRIDVVADMKDGLLTVCVKDDGIGMSRETLKNVFEKFYRAHTSDVHNVKGFGLGLCYVKSIVEAHGGSVSVKSKLGEGSEFEIRLPLSHQPATV